MASKDESNDIVMTPVEENTVDSLTEDFANLKVDGAPHIFRQGSTDSKHSYVIRNNPTPVRAAVCRSNLGEEITIPNDQITYIIAAHGAWSNTNSFNGYQYPDGHGPFIQRTNSFWENINMGVLVSEGVLLLSDTMETRQQAVMRHISGIIGGQIRVYQRFPWRNSLQDTHAIFPNIIFGEGGDVRNPFVSTIARYYQGELVFFQLRRSVDAGRLIPFNELGTFPVNDAANPLNLNSTNMVLLSQLIDIIRNDVVEQISHGRDIRKLNVAFASCMEGVPENIHNIWTGRLYERYPIVYGGKRKKRRKKKSRKRKTKRKNRRKKKSHKRKSRKKRKKKRKTKRKR